MSNEERQRILREAGSRPGEAEKQEGARESRQELGRDNAEAEGGQQPSPDERAPLAEDDESRPRPRR